MSTRQPFVALTLAALAFVACTKKEAVAPPPPPPPPPPPAPVVCSPIGVWDLDGPNGGKDQVEIAQGETKDIFIVRHKNVGNMPGVGTLGTSEFKVDMSKTTLGLYSCKINDDCKTMSCNFAGAPAVMSKP